MFSSTSSILHFTRLEGRTNGDLSLNCDKCLDMFFWVFFLRFSLSLTSLQMSSKLLSRLFVVDEETVEEDGEGGVIIRLLTRRVADLEAPLLISPGSKSVLTLRVGTDE